MKQTIYHTYHNLTYNLRTLIYFEVLYRVLGLLIIFPVARFLFYYSVRLTGHAYITNQLFFTYIFNPSTIMILLFLVVLLSIYLVIEMIFLSLIYDFGYHDKSISFRDLIILGFRKSYFTFKKYHIFIIMPAFLLFFTVQLIHFVGIYSTISLPNQIVYQLNQMALLKWSIFFVGAMLVVLFFETSFSLNLYTLDQLSFKDAYKQSRSLLKKQRLKMIFEFILVNVLLNILFYSVYLLIILLIGLFVWITRDQSYVLGVLLTLMYSIYAVIGLIAGSFLIPINYALLSTWYYQHKERLGLATKGIRLTNKERKAFSFKTLKRVSFGLLVVLFALNITSVISIIRQDRVQIELFNYAQIVAHRGASWDAPENTLAALELAIEQGSDAVEFDVRETNDRFPVLIHDATTGRTTDDLLNRNVSSLTLSQIKDLDAGRWFSEDFRGEKIPTLEEAFELIDGRTRAFVELKVVSLTLESQTVRIIESYNMVENSVILSFNRDQLRRIKELNPNLKTLLLVPVFYGDINVMLNYQDIDYYGFSRDIISQNPHFVELAHQKGKSVYVWTVNSEQNLQEAVLNDVDGIITDRPVLAREIAYAKNTSTVLQDFLKQFLNRG